MSVTFDLPKTRLIKAKDLVPGMVVVYSNQRHNHVIEEVTETRLNEIRVSSNNDTSISFYDPEEMLTIGVPSSAQGSKISMKKDNASGVRRVYRGRLFIANISRDHDEWLVNWVSGRVDRHCTLSEAVDNALKG